MFLNFDKNDWKDYGKVAGIGVVALGILALAIQFGAAWLPSLVIPVLTSGAGWLIGRNEPNAKTKKAIFIALSAIGLIAGIGFLFTL